MQVKKQQPELGLDARWCKADHLPQTPGPGSIAHELIAAFCRKHGC